MSDENPKEPSPVAPPSPPPIPPSAGRTVEPPPAARLPSPPPPPPGVAPSKKGRGCGFWLLAALAALFFGTTMLLFLVVMGMTFAEGNLEVRTGPGAKDRGFIEQTVEGHGDHKVLLVPVAGIIGDLTHSDLLRPQEDMVEIIHDMLQVARRDGSIKAILLNVDSPGGGITASDVLYHELAAFQKETGKPVVALFGDVAASGGYYAAAAAQRIVAHPTTITGSIGVIMPLFGIEDLLLKIGVQARPVKSGPMKDAGAMYRPMTDEEKRLLDGIVREYYERFVSVVHEGMKGRGVQITRADLEKYCDGRVFTGEQAKAIGFVDEIGYFDDAFKAACKKANLNPSNARVVTYRRKPGLLDLLFARLSAPSPNALNVRIDGLAPRQTAPFMYLWSVQRTKDN